MFSLKAPDTFLMLLADCVPYAIFEIGICSL